MGLENIRHGLFVLNGKNSLNRTMPTTLQPVKKVYQLFQVCPLVAQVLSQTVGRPQTTDLDKTTTTLQRMQNRARLYNTLSYSLEPGLSRESSGNCFSAHLAVTPDSSSKLCWLPSAQKGQGSDPKFQEHLPFQCPLQALSVSGRDSCQPQGYWVLHCPSQENLASSAFVPPLEI